MNENENMESFLNKNYFLESESAKKLYFQFAENQPIIDYHCHLPPDEIANNRIFNDLTEAWLEGDHYKWRAMRANGISEEYITGNATNEEKFMKWAETVPYTMRNPLYHWTHLELRRYFGIEKILSPKTAKEIYAEASEKLRSSEFSAQNLLRKMKVKVVGTTDDPTDSLEYHVQLQKDNFDIKIVPTFRPDLAMKVDDLTEFNAYIHKLEIAANVNISSFSDFKNALQNRHDFFSRMGCKVSDHGLNVFYAENFTEADLRRIFAKIRVCEELTHNELVQFKSGMLVFFSKMNFEKKWVQQFHVGALRNVNPPKLRELGANTGFDSIGDYQHGEAMSQFFAMLEEKKHLPKAILYNLNPADNYLFASMVGNFQDASIPGKMQLGSSWWFLDQKEGIEWQLNALSNLGLLSRFVGMLTDSRSFLSYPRHEYFRRILCNLLGNDIEKGLLPNDLDFIGQMVKDICYNNAKRYFNFSGNEQNKQSDEPKKVMHTLL